MAIAVSKLNKPIWKAFDKFDFVKSQLTTLHLLICRRYRIAAGQWRGRAAVIRGVIIYQTQSHSLVLLNLLRRAAISSKQNYTSVRRRLHFFLIIFNILIYSQWLKKISWVHGIGRARITISKNALGKFRLGSRHAWSFISPLLTILRIEIFQVGMPHDVFCHLDPTDLWTTYGLPIRRKVPTDGCHGSSSRWTVTNIYCPTNVVLTMLCQPPPVTYCLQNLRLHCSWEGPWNEDSRPPPPQGQFLGRLWLHINANKRVRNTKDRTSNTVLLSLQTSGKNMTGKWLYWTDSRI